MYAFQVIQIRRLVFALMLGWAGSSQAVIMFTTDTNTDLIGTWLVTGNAPGELLASVSFAPLLPDANPLIALLRGATTLRFGADGVGLPNNPFESVPVPLVATLIPDLSGTFNNNPTDTDVFFLFSNLQDTGGAADGTFTGDFCFSVNAASCGVTVPTPVTLALVGVGLAVISFRARRLPTRDSSSG